MAASINIKELVKGTLIYSGGQIISRAASFFLLPLMTAKLTPEDYGVLGILAALTQGLTGFFTLGFSVPISRDYRLYKDDEAKHSLIWTAFFILLCYNLLLLSGAILFSGPLTKFFLGDKSAYFMLLSLSTLSLSTISGPFNLYLRIEEKPYTALFFSLLEIALSLSLTLFFLLKCDFGVLSPLLGAFCAQGIAFFGYFAYGLFFLIKAVDFRTFLTPLFRQGSPYIFGFAGYFLLTSGGRFMLEKMDSLSETGLFFMAQNLAKPLDLIIFGFASAWPATLSRLSENKLESYKILEKLIFKAFIASFVLAFPFFAFAKPVVHTMLNANFTHSINLIGLLAFSQSLWGVYLIASSPLILNKKNLLQVLIEFLSGVSCILFAYFLVPLYGALGASIASLFGFSTLLTATLFYGSRENLKLNGALLLKVFSAFFFFSLLTFIPLQGLLQEITFATFLTGLFYASTFHITKKKLDFVTA